MKNLILKSIPIMGIMVCLLSNNIMVAQDAHITFTYRQEMIWRYYVVWITYNFQLQSMKSKINENLYITGEMLDVNGDCGGYNLTFAFISGYLSGKDIK